MSVLTYVYALVRAHKRPQLRAMPGPMPDGEPVRLLAAGEALWLVVSTVPAQAYAEEALGAGLQNLDWIGPRAVAHEAVVEHFLSCPAVLPMQLFTLFTSDERAVEHVLHTHERIARILARIERHLEWGVRLAWDEQLARAAVEQQHRVAEVASGASYLALKRDLLDVHRSRWSAARAAADALYRTLRRAAAAARRHGETEEAAPDSRMLLAAAFLVSVDQADAFKALLRQQEPALAEVGAIATLTGPWPPYNFV